MDTAHESTLWRRLVNSTMWGVLLVPLFSVLAYACFTIQGQLLSKRFHEALAPVFLGIAGLIFVQRWLREARPVSLLLAVLTTVLLCGDLQVLGTMGLYAALVVVAAWGGLWWRHIAADLRESESTSVLIFAALAYMLSQTVPLLPLEHLMASKAEAVQFGIGLEEALENLGHISMLFVAVLGVVRWEEDEEDESATLATTLGTPSLTS